ncbi:MAG: glutamyl-tRNA reductase, partial [Desulfovibrionaceae bacterium]|nr:glutamyl-tRNA reductase [Desulfovibrionaceae bacterium]
ILNKLFHRAFSAAKQVRTQTRLGCAPLSLANVAVDMARERLGGLERISAMLIGAGDMARLTALQLRKKGCRQIIIANRSQENAARLAEEAGGEVVSLGGISKMLPQVELLFSAWGGNGYIVESRDMQGLDRTQPLCCFDLGLPRTLDPSLRSLPGLELYDLDDIQKRIDLNRNQRETEVESALRIVGEQVESYFAWQAALELEPTIVDLYRYTRRLAEAELDKTLRSLPHLNEAEIAALRRMLDALVKKFNHNPVRYLKNLQAHHGDASVPLSLVRNLFNLDEEN